MYMANKNTIFSEKGCGEERTKKESVSTIHFSTPAPMESPKYLKIFDYGTIALVGPKLLTTKPLQKIDYGTIAPDKRFLLFFFMQISDIAKKIYYVNFHRSDKRFLDFYENCGSWVDGTGGVQKGGHP